MGYPSDPAHHAAFWGRQGWSSITQPPMYGHAIAELAARGITVDPELLERATAGLRFLLDRRRRSPGGLVEIVHPWESGADDSPRWDDLVGGAEVDRDRRRRIKGELVAAVGDGHGNVGFALVKHLDRALESALADEAPGASQVEPDVHEDRRALRRGRVVHAGYNAGVRSPIPLRARPRHFPSPSRPLPRSPTSCDRNLWRDRISLPIRLTETRIGRKKCRGTTAQWRRHGLFEIAMRSRLNNPGAVAPEQGSAR